MSQQSKGLPLALANEIDEAISRDLDEGNYDNTGQSKVIQSPVAQKVAKRLAERDDSPHGRLKLMVDESRAKLTELDDQREKLEALRDVQLEQAQKTLDARREASKKSIAEHEERIAILYKDITQGDADGAARIAKINADIDLQVKAIDTMESLHRNVVESAAKDVTPKKIKAVKDDDDLPF